MKGSNTMRLISTTVAVGSVALLARGLACAAEPPVLKPGLWEVVRVSSQQVDQKHLMTMCLDESVQAEMREVGMGMAKNMCSQNDRSFDGTRMVVNSVCQMGSSTLTSKAVTTFKGNTAYHTEVSARYEPPMMGTRESNMSVDARWVSQCKPGQKPGDMTLDNGQTINVKSFMTK